MGVLSMYVLCQNVFGAQIGGFLRLEGNSFLSSSKINATAESLQCSRASGC